MPSLTPTKVITQGQQEVDNSGLVKFNPKTGVQLQPGETVDTSTGVAPTITQGQEEADNSGTVKYNPYTRELLKPGETIATTGGGSPQPSTGAVAQTTPTESNYTIAKGDTLSQIAEKNGTNIQAIMRLNPSIKNPNIIQTGAQLKLPGQIQGTQSAGTANSYQNALYSNISKVPDTSDLAAVAKAAADTTYPGQELPPQASLTVNSLVGTLTKTLGDILSPTATQPTLTENYKTLSTQLGIDELNTQLMDIQNVMNGTEDDVRAEVTKAGGFATDSQVLAMTASRNKTLIKQANMLQQQLAYKQSTLTTLTDLDEKDRTLANQKVEMATNLTESLIQIQQTMQSSAADAYNKIIAQAGYTGLANALKGDPYSMSLAEQALRLPQGTLSNPTALKGLETYRQQSLAQSATRINISSGSADALTASRYSTAINSTIRALYPTNKNPIQTYNNSSQAINRVDESYKMGSDPNNSNKAASDLDLLDSYISIARGGQPITEAQVDTLLSGLGIKAKFDVATQKVTGTGILDNGTRTSIYNLSHNIYDGQQELANQAVGTLNQRLGQIGIPSQYQFMSPEEIGDTSQYTNTGEGTSYYNNEEYYQASDGNWYPKQ